MQPSLAEILTRERVSVFFHAPWSGPSVVALRQLRARAVELRLTDEELRIVNVDEEQPALEQLAKDGFATHGAGEVAVIRHGAIRYFAALWGEDMPARIDAFFIAHRA